MGGQAYIITFATITNTQQRRCNMEIILLIAYLWLGIKSITFIRTKIFKLEYIYIGTFTDFIFRKLVWAIFFGWITIPIWLILSLLGVGRSKKSY